MDGLAAVVQQQLRLDPFCGAVFVHSGSRPSICVCTHVLDPFCGAVFVFRAKRADRVKSWGIFGDGSKSSAVGQATPVRAWRRRAGTHRTEILVTQR